MAAATIRWDQQFATLYVLVAGQKPMTAEKFLSRVNPHLSAKFQPSPRRLAVQSVPIVTQELVETDEGEIRPRQPGDPIVLVESAVISVTGGPFDGLVVRRGDRYITGAKMNLRMKDPPATVDRLATFRANELRAMGSSLSGAGYDVQTSTIRPYGQSISGDRGIPPTPALPPDPGSIVGLVLGGTMLLSSLFIERLAKQGRIPGFATLGVTDEEFLRAEEEFANQALKFDRSRTCTRMRFHLNKMTRAYVNSGQDADIGKQLDMRFNTWRDQCSMER